MLRQSVLVGKRFIFLCEKLKIIKKKEEGIIIIINGENNNVRTCIIPIPIGRSFSVKKKDKRKFQKNKKQNQVLLT